MSRQVRYFEINALDNWLSSREDVTYGERMMMFGMLNDFCDSTADLSMFPCTDVCECGGKSAVIDCKTSAYGTAIRRTRTCLSCGRKWSTYEVRKEVFDGLTSDDDDMRTG